MGTLATMFDEPSAKKAMILIGQQMMFLLPVGFGCLQADRLVRDELLGVRQVLDAASGHHNSRLLGKYFGTCAATAVPSHSDPSAMTGCWP
jgi:hypothetical protein